ncbi:MAG TPA: HAMP domain-containing sensor histidine kinase [Devosiaceae bacterium]|nr:HAMP domain-containing sensor histidine kinase [Devosiaceae bacterium]
MPSASSTTPDWDAARQPRDRGRNTQRTVLDARQRLTSSSGTRASYDYELLSGYVNARMSGIIAAPALIVILALAAGLWVPQVAALVWGAIVILAHFGVIVVCRQFRAADPVKFDAQRWTATFMIAETGHGVAWAAMALLTLTSGNPDVLVILFAMLLVGMAVNGISTRTLPTATLMSTLPATFTVGLNLVVTGGSLNWSLAALALGAQIFFYFLARKLHRSEISGLEHQAEKDALIYELGEAKSMSDEARRHAEQANIAKSRFLATMSHELRTPLNAIIGFSEVMRSELLGPHSSPQYKDYANDIHASGEHLLNLINELLDLSRIEAGKYELNEEAICLIDIGDDCRRMLEIRARSKSIEMITDFDEALPRIWGDERAVRQVALNLLTNAIKFTPQSGKVLFSIRRSTDGGQIISVRDNGPGIPEEEITTVLSSFGQGSLAQKTAEQGAGLGLPIVQKIMELHQGRFDIFSKPRFGTEAIATFPRGRVMDALKPVDYAGHADGGLEIYPTAS